MGPALVVLAVALLLAPVAWLWFCPLVLHCAGRASTQRPSHGSLALGLWPLGLEVVAEGGGVQLRARLLGLTVWRGRRSDLDAEEEHEPSAQPTQEPAKARNGRTLLPSRGGALRIARFVLDQRRQLRLDRLQGAASFGFEDPADTGYADGLCWTLRGSFPAATRHFAHQPDWSGATCLDAQGELRVRAFFGRALLATVGLLYALWQAGEISVARRPRRA